MDWTAVGIAVAVILAGEWIVGHVVLFALLHHLCHLSPHAAVRLGHLAGLALGWACAAFVVAQASPALVCWGGAPLLPGAIIAALAAVWLLLVLLLPPGLGGSPR